MQLERFQYLSFEFLVPAPYAGSDANLSDLNLATNQLHRQPARHLSAASRRVV